MILTHPGLTKLTFMDCYLLTMLRNLLRRKLSYDMWVKDSYLDCPGIDI